MIMENSFDARTDGSIQSISKTNTNFYDDTNSNDIMSMVDSTNQSENGINQNNQGPHIKKEKLC